MKPKDNKELRELEEAIEQANREYTDTFSPIEETKRMYRIYTIEYDKDGNDKGGFTHQDDLLKLEKALAQAKKEGAKEENRKWLSMERLLKQQYIKQGREEAVKKLNGLWSASRSELMQGNNKREIEVLDIFYGRIKDCLKEKNSK
jgi:hypothetical protein